MKFRHLSLKQTIRDIRSTAQYCWDPHYVWWTAVTTPARGKRVVKIMQEYFTPKDRILDVGSSQGLTLGYIAQAFPKVEGIDIDEEALTTAKKRLAKLRLRTRLHHYEGKVLPFKNNTFDGVVATEVFEHVDSRDQFVKELMRVLKPRGSLIITAPNKLYPIECEFHLPFLSYLPKFLADIYVRLSKKGHSYDHINHPFYSEFRGILNKYSSTTDITLHIIKNYKKYSLGEERGKIIPMAAFVVGISNQLNNGLFSPISGVINFGLTQASAGWVFVCRK